MTIEQLTTHKWPGVDQIPAELFTLGGRTICSEIHKLTNSILNKEELPEEWKESIIVPIYKKGDKKTSYYRGISLLSTTIQNFIQHPAVKVKLTLTGASGSEVRACHVYVKTSVLYITVAIFRATHIILKLAVTTGTDTSA